MCVFCSGVLIDSFINVMSLYIISSLDRMFPWLVSRVFILPSSTFSFVWKESSCPFVCEIFFSMDLALSHTSLRSLFNLLCLLFDSDDTESISVLTSLIKFMTELSDKSNVSRTVEILISLLSRDSW